MSSIDDTVRSAEDELIDAIFERHVVSAALAMAERGERLFPLGFEPGRESYFVTRERRSLTRADLEWPVVGDPAELESHLTVLWADGPAELRALISPIVALSERLWREPTSDGPEDVSDFVYPMF